MTIGSIIALIIIAFFGLYGYRTGFLRSLGAIVGIVIGAVVAVNHYGSVASFLLPFLGNNGVIAGIVGFTILFMAVQSAVGLLFLLLDRAFKLVAIIPGLKAMNKLGGFILGVLEGALIVGVVLNAYTQLPLPDGVKATPIVSPWLNTLMTVSTSVLPGFKTALGSATTLLR